MGNSARKHRREKANNLSFLARFFCETHNLHLQVNNNGKHWIVSNSDRRADYWPSTGRVVFNLNHDNPYSVASVFTFLELINERWRPVFNTLNEEYADIVS